MDKDTNEALNTMVDVLVSIGDEAEQRMKKTNDPEQKAFLFGHLNLAAAVSAALASKKSTKCIELNLNYKNSLKAYNAAKADAEKLKDILKDQISIEDILPELIEMLKENKKSKKE